MARRPSELRRRLARGPLIMTLKLAERVATSQTWLDGLSDRLQPVVRQAVAGTGRVRYVDWPPDKPDSA